MVKAQLRDSSDLLANPKELRSRADEDGYLFLRGALPKDLILELREQFLDICQSYGWLEPGADRLSGKADVEAIDRIPSSDIAFCGVGIPRAAYEDVQRLELFHTLAHHPRLLAIYRGLFGKEVLPHPRNIARIMLPTKNNSPTPPHQDFIHIQGTIDVWPCWIPVGDCPEELGGLSVLRGSHKTGLLPVQQAEGAGNLEVVLCKWEDDWVSGPMEAGDILTFSSRTVHKARPNLMNSTIRLSCDYRFQPADGDIEEKSLVPHCQVLAWEDIYRDWRNEDLKYYWKKKDLNLSPWDESLRWQKVRICD